MFENIDGESDRRIQECSVSIICDAYNHEKYIARALDSFLMQKTSFKFEVLVHDDASTDKTADIIKKYANNYPQIICPIFDVDNQYNKVKNYLLDIYLPHIHGKYIALCEGDDYWIASDKLQRQYEHMEKNPKCVLCVHEAIRVTENEKFIGDYSNYNLVSKEGMILKPEFIIRNLAFFPTNSLFFSTDFILKNEEILRNIKLFDYIYKILFATEGEVFLIAEKMSAYRVSAQGSWTERVSHDSVKMANHLAESIKYLSEIKDYREGKYSENINEEILRRKYRLLLCQHNFKAAIEKEYNSIRRSLGWKHQIKLMLAVCFPRIAKLIYLNTRS